MKFLVSFSIFFASVCSYASNSHNHELSLRLLSYNVKGLPPVAAPGWDPARFAVIAERLSTRLAEGSAPDIVMLQEVFIPNAAAIVTDSGYPFSAQGPTRNGVDESGPYQRIYNSGLYILSRFPILESGIINYKKTDCATWDCYANKGIQYVVIRHPDLDVPITVFNTHMQADEANDEVRLRQIDTLQNFVNSQLSQKSLFFFGGDFNSSPDLNSFSKLKNVLSAQTAGEFCITVVGDCQLLGNTNPAKVFESAIDHIFYRGTDQYQITPRSVERNFTEIFGNNMLSDHLGYEAKFLIHSR